MSTNPTTCTTDLFVLTNTIESDLPEFNKFNTFPKFLDLPFDVIRNIIKKTGTVYRERKEKVEYKEFEACENIYDLTPKDQLNLGYFETKRRAQINLIDVLTGYTGMYSRYETNTLTEEDLEMLKQFISPNFRPINARLCTNDRLIRYFSQIGAQVIRRVRKTDRSST